MCVIVVLGFLDVFVNAHHRHGLDFANDGNFGDCLTRRVRFMTAITPAYAYVYQTICLAMHFLGVPPHLPRSQAHVQVSIFPNDHSNTSEVGNDYHGCAIFTDGGTRVVDGGNLCWMVCDIPITSWAHLCHVWSRRHHRGSSGFLWCQNSLQQHR